MNVKMPCIPDMLPIERIEWEQIARPIENALLELGRFDGTLTTMLNPSVLLSLLVTNEAVLSSRIEGTQVSLTEALEYGTEPPKNEDKLADMREVINYRRALQNAEQSLEKNEETITMPLIRTLHKQLMLGVRGGDKTPGEFRREQNWIGKKGEPMEKARFVPPSPMIMNDYLDNWKEFLNKDYPSPLVQCALIHAQFEIIHPFSDGNGRLGRMLVPLFLYQKGILRRPVFYISEYLEKHDEEYRDRLLAITNEKDWMGWLTFFLVAIGEQAKINKAKTQAIQALYEEMKEKFREATHSQFAQAALDAFFQHPVLSSTHFTEVSGIDTRPTANNILKQLKDNHLIYQLLPGAGQRPTIYCFGKLIATAEGRS